MRGLLLTHSGMGDGPSRHETRKSPLFPLPPRTEGLKYLKRPFVRIRGGASGLQISTFLSPSSIPAAAAHHVCLSFWATSKRGGRDEWGGIGQSDSAWVEQFAPISITVLDFF